MNRERIIEAILTPIEELRPEQIKYLPKRHVIENITPLQLNNIWEHLQPAVRLDREVQENLPCYEHWNMHRQVDHIDGPAPRISQCARCNRK